MDFTLNELSLAKLNDKDEAIRVLKEFSYVLSTLNRLGFKTIKIWDKNIFYNFYFADGFKFSDWLKQKYFNDEDERVSNGIIKSIIQRKDSIFNTEEASLIMDCPIVGIQLQEKQEICAGLKIACLNKTIAVSFNVGSPWDLSFLDLIYIIEDELQEILEQTATVKHAANCNNLDKHKEWFNILYTKGKINTGWIPADDYFPLIGFSNQLIENGDWNNFYNIRDKAKSYNDRLAYIIEIGKKVAERNFYTFDKKISALNSTRDVKRYIYGAGEGKIKIYLSTDLEKGGFEVCNYLGEHLGEFFFDGSKKSGPKLGHGIHIKS